MVVDNDGLVNYKNVQRQNVYFNATIIYSFYFKVRWLDRMCEKFMNPLIFLTHRKYIKNHLVSFNKQSYIMKWCDWESN